MKNIILIGPRSAGKSKISRALSKETGRTVLSTDSIAVFKLGGIPISDYIASPKGNWREFRELEFTILQDLQNANQLILDCGGGILFDLDDSGNEIFSNRKLGILKSLGPLVYLQRPMHYLLEKVMEDDSRPSLSEIHKYEDILKRRIPIYEEAADFAVDVDGLSKEKAAKKILQILA